MPFNLIDVHQAGSGEWLDENPLGVHPQLWEYPRDWFDARFKQTQELAEKHSGPVDIMLKCPVGVKRYFQGYRKDSSKVLGDYLNPVDLLFSRQYVSWFVKWCHEIEKLAADWIWGDVILYSGAMAELINWNTASSHEYGAQFYADFGVKFAGDATDSLDRGRGARFMASLQELNALKYTEAIPKRGWLPQAQIDTPHLVQLTRWRFIKENPELFETCGKPGVAWYNAPDVDAWFPEMRRDEAVIATFNGMLGCGAGTTVPYGNLTGMAGGWRQVRGTPYESEYLKLAGYWCNTAGAGNDATIDESDSTQR